MIRGWGLRCGHAVRRAAGDVGLTGGMHVWRADDGDERRASRDRRVLLLWWRRRMGDLETCGHAGLGEEGRGGYFLTAPSDGGSLRPSLPFSQTGFGEVSVTAPPSVHMLFSGSLAERGRPWTIRCFGQPWEKVQRHTNLFENPQRIDTLTLTGTSSRSANFVMTGTGPSDLVPKGRLLAVVRSLSRPYPGRSQRSRQSQSLRGGWIPERAKGGRCPAHCRGRCC